LRALLKKNANQEKVISKLEKKIKI